ncbi:DUF4817 domain-containing protein [Trichonephila clavipes]|nr:DUF4817 domain-containing protein [Trichonephila clavipes]
MNGNKQKNSPIAYKETKIARSIPVAQWIARWTTNPKVVVSNPTWDGLLYKNGYVKSLVYADKPQKLDHLEDNIRRVIADIRLQMLEKVIENWTPRLDYIRASRGSPMPEIIFKICQVIYSQFGLAIHQNDHQARRRFVEWAQNEIAVVPDFHKRILFSDEARFWLNGYVNKQNGRIWSEANPQVYVETPLHPEKLTVWCALWAGGILLQKR